MVVRMKVKVKLLEWTEDYVSLLFLFLLNIFFLNFILSFILNSMFFQIFIVQFSSDFDIGNDEK